MNPWVPPSSLDPPVAQDAKSVLTETRKGFHHRDTERTEKNLFKSHPDAVLLRVLRVSVVNVFFTFPLELALPESS